MNSQVLEKRLFPNCSSPGWGGGLETLAFVENVTLMNCLSPCIFLREMGNLYFKWLRTDQLSSEYFIFELIPRSLATFIKYNYILKLKTISTLSMVLILLNHAFASS